MLPFFIQHTSSLFSDVSHAVRIYHRGQPGMEQDASSLAAVARPRKKPRNEVPEGATDKVHPIAQMYFDLVPDAVENIMRCSSSRPNAEDWSKYIDENGV